MYVYLMVRHSTSPQEAEFGKRLGRVVRGARESKGWSAPDMAGVAGVSLDAIRSIESGRVASPGFALIVRLAACLDID